VHRINPAPGGHHQRGGDLLLRQGSSGLRPEHQAHAGRDQARLRLPLTAAQGHRDLRPQPRSSEILASIFLYIIFIFFYLPGSWFLLYLTPEEPVLCHRPVSDVPYTVDKFNGYRYHLFVGTGTILYLPYVPERRTGRLYMVVYGALLVQILVVGRYRK
jgi:hypothetical protein